MIRFKPDVPPVTNLHPRLRDEVLPKAEHLFAAFGLDVVVTASSNGQHRVGSKHYAVPCQALDLRSKHMARESDKVLMREMLAAVLGPDYDVLYESQGKDNQHFHVELDI